MAAQPVHFQSSGLDSIAAAYAVATGNAPASLFTRPQKAAKAKKSVVSPVKLVTNNGAHVDAAPATSKSDSAALEVAVNAWERSYERAQHDAAAKRMATWALHEVLDLVERGYHPARKSFYGMRADLDEAYGPTGMPEKVAARAAPLKLMNQLQKKRSKVRHPYCKGKRPAPVRGRNGKGNKGK